MAQVYVVEVFKKPWFELRNPTVRIGLDGSWIGATRGNSYVVFSVDHPGEHHLCAQWQSGFERYSREAAFNRFTAELDKRYYFRVRITYQSGLELEPLDSDEANSSYRHPP